MNYSKEDYEFLKQFKSHFDTAIKSHFVRMDNRNTLASLEAIFVKTFHRSSNILGGCARCVCDAVAKLGQKWYEDKSKYEEMEKAKVEIPEEKPKNKPIDLIDENCASTITKTAKKPSAKKKTTKNKK